MNVWVTGATSGIGKSLTLALAAQGHRVFASARNQQELSRLEARSSNICGLECDITDFESVERAVARLETISSGVDQIILNAGTCEYLDFPDPDWDIPRRVMEVNFFGTLNCTRAALPILRKSETPSPHIVVIASQVTAAPFPRAEAYGASKAALQYFFDSLRLDLVRDNIDITIVNPGFVDTPLTQKNDFDMPFLISADKAAEKILKHIEKRPRHYSFPGRLSALLKLSKWAPRVWQKMVGVAPMEESKRGL